MEYGEFPVLVTMPAHLVLQWKLQLELWGVPAEEVAAAPRGCGPDIRHAALTSNSAFTLVSYNTWANYDYLHEVLDPRWKAFVFDEVHRLRTGKATSWHSVRHLRNKTKTKHTKTPIWALTGTPLVKDASDIWPFMWLVNKYRYGSRDRFAQQQCFTYRGPYKLEIGKVRDPEAFRTLLGNHSIRRSWRDIPSLAKLSRRDVELPIELDQATLQRHRGIKRDYRDPTTGEALESSAAMVHALRRLSVPAKVEAVTEYVLDHPGPCLVLCWYRDTVRSVESHLLKRKYSVSVIHGGTSEQQRSQAINRYKHGDILVGTIGSMKEGWDSLQIGYQVVFVEQHFLSTDNEQAVARVLRRGQKRPVLVTWMYAPRTFDMRVRRMAQKRQDNIEDALGEFLREEEWRQ